MKLPHVYYPPPARSQSKINLQEYLQYISTSVQTTTQQQTTMATSAVTITTQQPWTQKPMVTTRTPMTTMMKTSPVMFTTRHPPLTTTQITTTDHVTQPKVRQLLLILRVIMGPTMRLLLSFKMKIQNVVIVLCHF